MSAFYISATFKSSGKTTLSIGICAALTERGHKVQPFKKGPDYIDPMWLGKAANNDCINLDFFTSSETYIQQQFDYYSAQKDVILVEGNKGLYDGVSIDGSDSNAAMTKLLQLPVVLVLDTTGTTRGVAPLLKGYQAFDQDVSIAGVILNKVGGSRHESKLRQIIEHYTDLEIFGAVGRSNGFKLHERHLGLIPSNEMASQADSVIAQLSEQINRDVNLDQLLSLARISHQPSTADADRPAVTVCAPSSRFDVVSTTPASASSPRSQSQRPLDTLVTNVAEKCELGSINHSPKNKIKASENSDSNSLRIAVAMDSAFGFYYPDDLQRFNNLGAEIVTFDTLNDSALPENIDGLFIGGGFPETQLLQLAKNKSLQNDIKKQIQQGLPAYAECGGLMYLCDSIEHHQRYDMVGIISARVTMHARPQGRGYVKLQTTEAHPWFSGHSFSTVEIKAHEFHYSSLHGLPTDTQFAYKLTRGAGIDNQNDGIILHNLLASYTHLRQTDQCNWVDSFISFVQHKKQTS